MVVINLSQSPGAFFELVEFHKESVATGDKAGKDVSEHGPGAHVNAEGEVLPTLAQTPLGAAFGRHCLHRDFLADYRPTDTVLGNGVTGQVRQGICRVTGREVAFKSFDRKVLLPRGVEELQNEIDVHLSLDHPHIVRLDRVYEFEDKVHLVMERLDGGELFDRLVKKTSFEEAEVADVLRQVLKAAAYLHGQGVVHRDIKLENLMYESPQSPHLKLIDFGFACKWDGKTEMTQRCGTLHYVAPEVLKGSYTSKVDIWSAGVIAYLLLTGKALYSGDDAAVRKKVLAARPDLSRGFQRLSATAQEFVRWLLSANPQNRPSAIEALGHPFLKCRTPMSVKFKSNDVLLRLQAASKAPWIQRGCLAALAWTLPRDVEVELRATFHYLDQDQDGVISVGDLSEALQRAGRNDQEAAQIVEALDVDGSGMLSFREVLAGVACPEGQVLEASITAAFARFDVRPTASLHRATSGESSSCASTCASSDSGSEADDDVAQPGSHVLTADDLCKVLGKCFGAAADKELNEELLHLTGDQGHGDLASFRKCVHDSLASNRSATRQFGRAGSDTGPLRGHRWQEAFTGCAAQQAAGGLEVLRSFAKFLLDNFKVRKSSRSTAWTISRVYHNW